MSRRRVVARFPPCWGIGPSSVVAALGAIVPKARFSLPRGQRIGPRSPMVRGDTRADALDMSDLRQVLGAAALATLVIGIAACGNGGDKTSTPKAANATWRADAQDLGRYLMRKDEE